MNEVNAKSITGGGEVQTQGRSWLGMEPMAQHTLLWGLSLPRGALCSVLGWCLMPHVVSAPAPGHIPNLGVLESAGSK